MKRILIIAAWLACAFCSAEENPLKVVVIGGGPTGLSTAIEARLAGADVVVVEKRGHYVRENALFLTNGTLRLLDKWDVPVPKMQRLFFEEERRGFVIIKHLEEDLAKRVHELGIRVLRGEFLDFLADQQAVVIDGRTQRVILPYDILVGADGVHSRVREKLGISITSLAQGICSAAMVQAKNAQNIMGIEDRPLQDFLIKKITIPSASFIFLQNKQGRYPDSIGKNVLIQYAKEAGFFEEAELISEDKARVLENVPVCLQWADTFSDRRRSTIILGEAAGCTAFYGGNGANYAFKTSALAGDFFHRFRREDAFDSFEFNMKIEIGVFMHESLQIFFKE